MFCKQTQNNVDALLRLKSNEDLCVHAIKQVMDQQDNNNKIASVQFQPVGELAEFQQLLKTYIR